MSEAPEAFFTPTQRKLIAYALGLVAFLAIITLLVFVVVVLSRLIGHFSHVIWPLAVAGILALLLRPIIGVFERRLRLSRAASVLVLYAFCAVLLVGAMLLYLPQLIRQLIEFINTVPEFSVRVGAAIQRAYPSWVDLYNQVIQNEMLRGALEGTLEQLRQLGASMLPNLKSAGTTVLGAFGVVANLAVIPIYLYFFLQSDEEPTKNLQEYLPFLKPQTRDDIVFLAREFVSIIVAFFRGQLVIALIEGGLFATAFGIIGLKLGVILGLMCGLLNIVPYLGTAIGLLAVLPTAYFQEDGGLLTLALCIGTFIVIQMLEGYFLTPRIMGRQTGLHPVTILLALFFWGTALNGVLGMILAIPLTAFLVTAWRLAKRKYFRPVA